MLKIGLTGSIGSGKSIVARILETLDVPVYRADDEAKKFLSNREVVKQIIEAFGDEVLDENRTINRKELAVIVFSDPNKLQKLNSIIHPYVKEDFRKWCENYNEEPYIIQEAAILFESGFDELFDKIITVTAPETIRIERVMRRDSVSESAVLNRMKNQLTDEEKVKRADYVIENDGETMIIPRVLDIHEELLDMADQNNA